MRGHSSPVQVSGLFPGEVAQADALISKGAGFVGNELYNTSGAGRDELPEAKTRHDREIHGADPERR